jgi:hypothetical protein
MTSIRRAVLSAGLLAASMVGGATITNASPFNVPPFQANDTGGIIAWSLGQQVDAKKLAADHCASYGKNMRPIASQRVYGGYISFACVWPRSVRSVHVLRVKG